MAGIWASLGLPGIPTYSGLLSHLLSSCFLLSSVSAVASPAALPLTLPEMPHQPLVYPDQRFESVATAANLFTSSQTYGSGIRICRQCITLRVLEPLLWWWLLPLSRQ